MPAYVRISEATKQVFGRWGEETGEFLLVYVFYGEKKLENLPDFGFNTGTCKTYEFNADPRFLSRRVEEKFGNKALLNYSDFVWTFCLPAEKKADLEKLLKCAE